MEPAGSETAFSVAPRVPLKGGPREDDVRIMAGFTREELERCIEMLEACVADRALLSAMDGATRVRLLMAAGRISRPTRDESRRMERAFRKKERKEVVAHDREATAATEIRTARRAEIYVAPPQLVGGAGEAAEARELRQPRA